LEIFDIQLRLIKPAFSSLLEDFLKRENNLIERLLTLGVKNKEFDIKDIPVMSDMFVTVTKGLRMMVIKQRDS